MNARVLSSWRWQLSGSCSFPLSIFDLHWCILNFTRFYSFFLWDNVLFISCHKEERYYETLDMTLRRCSRYLVSHGGTLSPNEFKWSHGPTRIQSDHSILHDVIFPDISSVLLFRFRSLIRTVYLYSIDRSTIIYANSSKSSSIEWHSDDPWTSLRTSSKSSEIH